MFGLILICALVQSPIEELSQSRTYATAEAIVDELDSETKAFLFETPSEWTSAIFDEGLGRSIRNRYGLRDGPLSDTKLLEECRELAPSIDANLLAYECTAIILELVVENIRASLDKDLVSSMDQQLNKLRETRLPKRNYFTDRDYHLIEVVDRLNEQLQFEGVSFQIVIDPKLLERSIEIGGGKVWEPVLGEQPRFHADDVLGALRRIKFELSTCLRRSPSTIWIGHDCSEFKGTTAAFD